MAQKPGIFPTFFLSGFKCSNFLNQDDEKNRSFFIHIIPQFTIKFKKHLQSEEIQV